MPQPRSYLVQSASVFLVIGFLVLMTIVLMNFWLAERAQTYFSDANTARDARVASVELRNQMQIAESSQRGFVITGNEIYLGPYETAKNQARRRLASLQPLLSSYPNTDFARQRLAAILDAKFEEFDRTIALKRTQHDAEVLSIFRTNDGKALTDEANVFISGIISKADDRLSVGMVEQQMNTVWLRLLSGIGAAVIVVVIGGATLGAARYTKQLRDARDEVDNLNTELEQRVAKRTADLALARDRAEVLLSEVNHRVANSLALVSSLVNIQSKAVNDRAAKQALAETQDRIFAISLVHKRLYVSADVRSVALDEYLTGLLEHLSTSLRSQREGITLVFKIAPIPLQTDASISLGVVVTELVTNSFKYAYPEGVGQIRVSLRQLEEDKAELFVEDDGVGRGDVAMPKGTGVGSRIINAMGISLGAQINYRDLNPGTAAHLVFSFSRPHADKASTTA